MTLMIIIYRVITHNPVLVLLIITAQFLLLNSSGQIENSLVDKISSAYYLRDFYASVSIGLDSTSSALAVAVNLTFACWELICLMPFLIATSANMFAPRIAA